MDEGLAGWEDGVCKGAFASPSLDVTYGTSASLAAALCSSFYVNNIVQAEKRKRKKKIKPVMNIMLKTEGWRQLLKLKTN